MVLGKTLESRRDMFPAYGLALFVLTAGLSKFFILDLWVGYEPRFLVKLLPATGRQLTLFGGIFEVFLGFALLSGKKTSYFALATTVYLFGITVQLVNLGLWDLAIRDLGLTLYALSVTISNF